MMLSCLVVAMATAYHRRDSCTTTAIGRLATKDETTVVTHTADCFNCDFRVAKITRHESPQLIRAYKPTYPAEVSDRGTVWSVDNLEYSTLDVEKSFPLENEEISRAQRDSWTSEEWARRHVVGSLDIGANETSYEMIESLYGIANTQGLTMGESTCAGKLLGLPARPCPSCPGPLLEISSLSKLGMRLCATARCAIELMGALAIEHGYYAAEQIGPEAGEALTVADGREAWMFHILPDDTGLSAIWAAQRVPDDSISVCANAFVIRGIENGPDSYLSDNAVDIAEKTGLAAYTSDGTLDFAKTFGPDPLDPVYPYSVHRVWRVMSLAAPIAIEKHVLATQADYLGSELPFAVSVEKSLDLVDDILAFQRDHYEGTPFDLTKGLAAGPWGDPTRYDGATGETPGAAEEIRSELPATRAELSSGRFERAISMFRTSYSIAAQSKDGKAVTWFAPGAPHASLYLPVTTDAEVPTPLGRGSLFEVTDDSMWWAVTKIANWMRANVFKMAVEDVREAQHVIETDLYEKIWREDGDDQDLHLDSYLGAWHRLFDKLVTKYRDGFVLSMSSPQSNYVEPDVKRHFYPEWWLRAVGYYNPGKPDQYYLQQTREKSSSPFLFYALVPLVAFLMGIAIGKVAFVTRNEEGTLPKSGFTLVSSRDVQEP